MTEPDKDLGEKAEKFRVNFGWHGPYHSHSDQCDIDIKIQAIAHALKEVREEKITHMRNNMFDLGEMLEKERRLKEEYKNERDNLIQQLKNKG